MRLPVLPDQLPCQPCPHHAVCCAFGTELDADEARVLSEHHGADTVYEYAPGAFRTRIDWKTGRCVFHDGGGCTIHDKPYYPPICRDFPWGVTDELVDPFEWEICPELLPHAEAAKEEMRRALAAQEAAASAEHPAEKGALDAR